MNSIQEEPFSEDQWDQFIKEYEKAPQNYFTSDEINTSSNPFTNTGSLAIPDFYGEQGNSNAGLGWTYQDTNRQSLEAQADHVPDIDFNQNPSAYEELKTLLEVNSRQIDQLSQGMNRLNQHLTDLHPYFAGIRKTLKELLVQTNRPWEAKSPSSSSDTELVGKNIKPHGKGWMSGYRS